MKDGAVMALPARATTGELVWQFVTGILGGATLPPTNALFDRWNLTGLRSYPANAIYLVLFLGIFAVLNRPVYKRRKAQGRPTLRVALSDLAADGAGTFVGYWIVTGIIALGVGGMT